MRSLFKGTNHLPKGPPPSDITLGIRLQHMNLGGAAWGHKQSRADIEAFDSNQTLPGTSSLGVLDAPLASSKADCVLTSTSLFLDPNLNRG